MDFGRISEEGGRAIGSLKLSGHQQKSVAHEEITQAFGMSHYHSRHQLRSQLADSRPTSA
ncbi:MAG: hypothetical protein LH702_29810 [Phormidesmis sp. CAN_BIN44]|nr:hypothetical protein [Phormidesmis sp. CAN_BIN44]